LGDELVPEKTAHPYVRARDIRDGKITFNDPVYVTDDIFQKIKNYTVKANDVCITIVGANVGDVGIIPPFLDGANLTENAVKLTELKDCDPFFLNFCLLSSEPQGQMKQYAAGAAQPKLGIYKVNEIDIPFPPIETQRKIASILSAYDDLIANNARRIKILEEMARMIYREWFVNFRFPGHEQVKMVDSPLGMIPEGWEVKTLGEVCSVIKRGVSPKYDDNSESIVINQKCIRDFRLSLKDSRKHNSKVPAEKYLAQGDVLINSTGVGTLGRVAQVLQDIKDCTADSHVTIVRPKESVDADFLGLQMFEMQEYIENLGQGATGQTELGRESIANTEVIVATKDIQEKFSTTVTPMRWLAKRLAEKNENLRQTRDLLLPKLISGNIEI